MSVLQPGLTNSSSQHPYWFNAILTGTLVNLLLFMALPNLENDLKIPDPAVIVVDFMQWQEPVKHKPKPAAAVDKPSSKTVKKDKPAIKQQVKPLIKQQPAEKIFEPPARHVVKPARELTESQDEPEKPEPVVKQTAQKEQFAEALPIPLPVFKATTLPRIAHLADLEKFYPLAKRQQGIEASVKVEVLIDRDGKARKVTVIKSAGAEFDQAAVAAIMASSFIPANFEGQPGPVLWRFPVSFRLK